MLSIFLLLGFLMPLVISDTDNHQFSECQPFEYTCGKKTYEIYYPFRLQGSPMYCGHPDFDLWCAGNATLLATVGSKVFAVNSIDYNSQTIELADHNFFADGACNTFTNTSFSSELYDYSGSDDNLTVYFNCAPVLRSLFPMSHNLSCFQSDFGNQSFYALPDEMLLPPGDATVYCGSVVVVPVDRSVVKASGMNLSAAALQRGFGLTWKVGDGWCQKCMHSNGICGNDPKSSGGVRGACFCSNSTSINWSCEPIRDAVQSTDAEKKISPSTIIGIVAGAIGALILICCLLLLLYNRRKKQQRSSLSNLLSRSTSSKISSKKDAELGDCTYHTHIFSYDELEEATNGFNASRELGDGGFGTVYKGKLRDGRTVAVKRLYENNYRRLEQFMNEVEILSRLRHQNLVTLYGCTSRHSRELLLVYEFIPNGTLADHLHGPLATEGALTWPVRMSVAIETADALAYLHAVEPQIIHRDIKTNNILLDGSFHVKVADFGLSRLFPLDATHVSTAPQGTPGYVDPEYHQCYQLTDKSDVYSFGVVLVELISSKPAVDISRHRHEINLASMAISKIQNRQIDQLVDPELGYHVDTEIKRMINQVAELAFRCLQSDGEMRPCIKEVLEVLKSIEGGGFKAEKEVDVVEMQTKEEARLLKNVTPFSPESVTERWSSRSTTPNASS